MMRYSNTSTIYTHTILIIIIKKNIHKVLHALKALNDCHLNTVNNELKRVIRYPAAVSDCSRQLLKCCWKGHGSETVNRTSSTTILDSCVACKRGSQNAKHGKEERRATKKKTWNGITKTILWFMMVASLVCMNTLLVSPPSLSLSMLFCRCCISLAHCYFLYSAAQRTVSLCYFTIFGIGFCAQRFSVEKKKQPKPTAAITMITSKWYSENRFEMAFKIRHRKLWMNAIKMHIYFQYCHTMSAQWATLARTHTHTP